MRRVLVTGMSGTGKSSALLGLGGLGFEVVDTDDGGWTVWSEAAGGYVWREDRIAELLDRERTRTLFVSGTVSNQGRFYDRFESVVLLSAPAEVLLARLRTRSNNPFGRTPQQRAQVLRDLAVAEPMIRRTCTHEIDATQPLGRVVELLASLAEPSGGFT